MNNVKVFTLMAGMTALFGAIGAYFGGQSGMMMALLFAGGMNFFMYHKSGAMVLRMYNAHVVTEREAPDLYAMVDRLPQRVRHRPEPGTRGSLRDRGHPEAGVARGA
jgi:heat shock protein HtpX